MTEEILASTWLSRADRARAAAIFHEVRDFAYRSDGIRDPAVVSARKAGSCTGKHLVLRQRLRDAGFRADIETVRGDFAAGIPANDSMSNELQRMLAEAGVEDCHNFVWLSCGDARVALDVTWPDAVARYGFPTNSGWSGEGNTRLALEPREYLGTREDVVGFKQQQLALLDEATLMRRARFLKLLTEWVESISPFGDAAEFERQEGGAV